MNYNILSFRAHVQPTFCGILLQALCQCETRENKSISSIETRIQAEMLPLAPQQYQVKILIIFHGDVNSA